ncbi:MULTISPECIES: hypothetical protein [unclassified Mycobacterium]|uniref:hypothetical protein n=1 Tax=unclassified Mycobacterium TaxID=2642494 RepID=UPI0029C8CED1|nr:MULTISPECIES: hypothetical protein [unclassified Mycobacterium]
METDTSLDTYRYLRGSIPVMLVMLGVALIIERVRASDWLGSISAYYFTGAHAVFIGSICAVGALLIVYKGLKPTEDILLNLAGILAFVVAFVPTSRPDTSVSVDVSNVNVITNVWAVVIALLVARAASWWMYRRTGTGRKLEPIANKAAWLQRAVLAAGLVALIVKPDLFVSHAHGIAAVVMFLAIIATVFLTAFMADKVVPSANPPLYHRIYQWIAIAMVVTLVAAVVVHFALDNFNHIVLVVEVVLIVEFGVYWAVQTVEKWSPTPTPRDEPVAAQCTPAQERVLDAL